MIKSTNIRLVEIHDMWSTGTARTQHMANNSLNRKPNKTKSCASSKDDMIRDITIETKTAYKFVAANAIIAPLDCRNHTIKETKRQNEKPKNSNKYLICLQEL